MVGALDIFSLYHGEYNFNTGQVNEGEEDELKWEEEEGINEDKDSEYEEDEEASAEEDEEGNQVPARDEDDDVPFIPLCPKRAFNYLLDLERQGYVDGQLYYKLGDCYFRGFGCKYGYGKPRVYFQRALDLGYTPAYLDIHNYWYNGPTQNLDDALSILVEAAEKGVEDDRIYVAIIKLLLDNSWYTPRPSTLKSFANRVALAHHCCNTLTAMKLPKGEELRRVIAARWSRKATK